MSTSTTKPLRITIARTGTFTDSQGRPQNFSVADLAAIAAHYNPERLEAPLVFGHPRDADPAYGWVKSLEMAGNTLVTQLARVPDAVRKLVQDGHYRYVSMSLMPDRKQLRHVGLLGAAVPAIDGLGPVCLSVEEGFSVEFSQADPLEESPETLENIAGDVMRMEELEAKISALELERDSLKKQVEDARTQAADTAAEFAAYKNAITLKTREDRLGALVKAGKVKPAERSSVLSFAAALAALDSPVEFTAENGETVHISAEERYFRELSARPASGLDVDFSAFAVPGHAARASVPAFSAEDMTVKL